MNVPLHWVTATVARLMMSKMWLIVYHPYQRQNGGRRLPAYIKEKLFIPSLENIEYSVLLETEARSMKWGWLFRTYMQWHAMAFLMSELCHRTSGPLCERAWRAVGDVIAGHWAQSNVTKAGHLWRPLRKLYLKAKDAHKQGLAEAASRQGLTNVDPNQNLGVLSADPIGLDATGIAPRSHTQDLRFAQGAAHGQIGLESHAMMSSPIAATSLIPTDLQAVQLDPTTVPMPLMTENMIGLQDGSGTGELLAESYGDMTGISEPLYANGQSSNSMSFKQANSSSSFWNAARPDFAEAPAGPDSINDLPIVDMFGDLNWENWDQLVRQFGMDINGGTNTANGESTDPNLQNMFNPNTRAMNSTNYGMAMGGNSCF